MSQGVRESAEVAVRAGITHIQFAVRPEEDAVAIDEYLKTLQPVPSPYLVDGKLSDAAKRGKALFFSERVGCATCHPEPLYTDHEGARRRLERPVRPHQRIRHADADRVLADGALHARRALHDDPRAARQGQARQRDGRHRRL